MQCQQYNRILHLSGLVITLKEEKGISLFSSTTVSLHSLHTPYFASPIYLRQQGQACSPTKSGLWTSLNEIDCTDETLPQRKRESYHEIWDKWHLGQI